MKLTSFALIEQNDRFLLIKEASPKWRGKWFFPGGETQKNESPEQAVLRETMEETACNISVKGMFYSKYYHGLLRNNLCFYYYAEPLSPVIKKEPDKHSLESRWFKYEEVLSLPLRDKDNVIEIINRYRNLKKSHSLN
jgi:8-oxo-dGTP pyrophosphatase MutT (NUDIX family)